MSSPSEWDPLCSKRRKGRPFTVFAFCAMEGEDEESDDPRAFGNAAGWKKVIVLVAGAFMNFLTGLIIVLVLYAPAQGFYQETYAGAMEGYGTEDCGLQEGDRFLSVDGHKVLTYGNAQFYLGRAGDTMDLVVERNGEKVYLDNVSLPRQERTDEEGNTTNYRGITIGAQVMPANLGTKLLYGWNTTLDYVRLVWVSLGDLVRGALQSIPVIQWESAQALGMKPIQVYTLVILPQTVRRLIPLSINLITRMVKTTSLVMMIGIVEVLKVAQQIIEANRRTSPNAAFGVFAVVFLLYFLICWPISRLAGYLEKRWS
mgnify:CR=1 FL=1